MLISNSVFYRMPFGRHLWGLRTHHNLGHLTHNEMGDFWRKNPQLKFEIAYLKFTM